MKMAEEVLANPPTLSGEVLQLRERVEDLISFSLGVGGLAKDVATKANKLRETLITSMREAFSEDSETLQNIDHADALYKHHNKMFHIPVVAQLLRRDSPIPSEETIPVVLSQDPGTISIVVDSLQDDALRMETLRIFMQTRADGYMDPQFGEKLSALAGERPPER
jgi:hypothetical protein